MKEGSSVTDVHAQNGSRNTFYEEVWINGENTGGTLVSSIITRQPVPRRNARRHKGHSRLRHRHVPLAGRQSVNYLPLGLLQRSSGDRHQEFL